MPTKLKKPRQRTQIICCACNSPITDNRAMWFGQGEGGVYANHIKKATVQYAHHGECSWLVNPLVSQRGMFWGNLPIDKSLFAPAANGFVYVIESDGAYKIGRSKNPAGRLKGLKTGNPSPMTIVGSIACANPSKVETYLHEVFKEQRDRGEWFLLTPEMLAWVLAFNPESIEGDSHAF